MLSRRGCNNCSPISFGDGHILLRCARTHRGRRRAIFVVPFRSRLAKGMTSARC
jgi:hypothetical protein